MKSQVAFLVFSFFISSLFHPSLSVGRCNSNDYKALLKIKQSFINPYQLASWGADTDCCSWYVIDCDEKTNRVTGLYIFSGEVSGQIPSEVGDLPYLESLTIRKLSNITGNIPRSITKLKHLKLLRLSWLNLSGPVPSFLSELTNLTFLELNYNQFSGPIPSSFSKFTNLGELHLDRNQLTGSIPESFGHFKGTVPDLFLSHNRLTGTIPKSFANLNFNRIIDLSRNSLTGDASMLFKPNRSAQIVDISRNSFEFDFSKVELPQSHLVSFDINHNKIYGGIPKGIVDAVDLQSLNVSYNRLCGQIPTGGQLDLIDSSAYIHNKCLCGPPLTTKC